MAVELIARVLCQPPETLDPSEKLVMVVMADRADTEGVLWYTVGTICHLTSFSRKSVQRIMSRLDEKGFLRRMRRSQQSNLYQMNLARLPLISIKRSQGEKSLLQMVEESEPELFAGLGDRRTPTPPVGDLGTPPGRPTDASRGDLGTPESVIETSKGSKDSERASAPETDDEPESELYDLVRDGWNAVAAEHEALPPVRLLSDGRKTLIEARTKEFVAQYAGKIEPPAVSLWRDVFDHVRGSRLLTGQSTDWYPTLDWILKASNFNKIMEGNYGRATDATDQDAPGARPARGGERSAVEAGREAIALVRSARGRSGAGRDQGAGSGPPRPALAGGGR